MHKWKPMRMSRQDGTTLKPLNLWCICSERGPYSRHSLSSLKMLRHQKYSLFCKNKAFFGPNLAKTDFRGDKMETWILREKQPLLGLNSVPQSAWFTHNRQRTGDLIDRRPVIAFYPCPYLGWYLKLDFAAPFKVPLARLLLSQSVTGCCKNTD